MKSSFLLLLLLGLCTLAPLRAAEEAREAALRTADDARVAAMQSPDRARLGAILSDDLRYAHSNGLVDTKASFLDSLLAGRLKYQGYDHAERSFTFPAPGLALMTGRTRIKVQNDTGLVEATLLYLAVWREEQGAWRFLAWQSCRLPPPPPAEK